MDKPIEFVFTLGLALTAPLLQSVIKVDMSAMILSLVVMSGALTYFTRAVINDNLNTKVAALSALTALPLGIFTAPAICRYLEVGATEYIVATHYGTGLIGVLILNMVWSIMAGIHKDAYPWFKEWVKSRFPFLVPKNPTGNNGSN